MSEAGDSIEGTNLRRGWTTGACATAASLSALSALLGRGFADPVTITLPGGQTPAFALAHERLGDGFAEAGIIKDAGDDPDVTHGALIIARVTPGTPGSGISFHAGLGVGTITKPGLPLPVGEPAINPVPRQMITEHLTALCTEHTIAPDFAITISVPEGEKLAEKTWNPRLGIVGGLSILGTTGIVVPYSCSAWIHSIQRGVDVARAAGLTHLVGSTGDRSEKAAMAHFGLPIEAYIDMGDFAGGLLKYVRQHPVKRLTISGGFAKITKLAQGAMDLHSARAEVDVPALCDMLKSLGADSALIARAQNANTANEIAQIALDAGLPLAHKLADKAQGVMRQVLKTDEIECGILIIDRQGNIIGEAS